MKYTIVNCKKDKIIFLDVDGVLNNHRFITNNQFLSSESRRNIDNEKVMVLKTIVAQTGARIVLSSSWRLQFDRSLQPLSGAAKELVDKLAEYGLCLWDKTDDCVNKVESINKWLEEHRNTISNYVIIDDDYMPDVVVGSLGCLIKISYYIGLTEKEAILAISKLNAMKGWKA